jgi:hypothetical protein
METLLLDTELSNETFERLEDGLTVLQPHLVGGVAGECGSMTLLIKLLYLLLVTNSKFKI